MKRRNLILGFGGLALAGGAGALGWRRSVGTMAEYAAYQAHLRRPLDAADTRDLIRAATLAANSHNTQPWRFHAAADAVEIAPDFTRRTPAVDPDDHHLFVSLGCAAENLAIAAAANGRPGTIAPLPNAAGLRFAFTTGAPRSDPLHKAIGKRQSSRTEYDGRPRSRDELAALGATAAMPGVDLVLVTERAQIGRIRDLIIAGNTEQMADPAFLRELRAWIRFNPRTAMARGDGLFAAASGNPSLPTVLGGLAFDRVFTTASENDRYQRQVDSAAGLAVFVAEAADPDHWIAVGRACQRFALAATSLGLQTAFLNQPVEVAALRPALAGEIGAAGRRPDIVMRFGAGPTLPYSPRRPVADILS